VILNFAFFVFSILDIIRVMVWREGVLGVQEKMMTDAVILSPHPNLMVLQ